MSGGFFRGTSADQDTRFSNKQAKLMKSQKFAPELEHLVDVTKVKMDVVKPWIAKRVTELLGFEDEVLINFIYGLLEGKDVNGKEVQISLTGFMEKNTGKFMKELWTLLLSAQNNASGVPQQFLDEKEEDTRRKKAEADRITSEIMRKREEEAKEFEQDKLKELDGGVYNSKATNAALEPISKHLTPGPDDRRETVERNGLRGNTSERRRSRSISGSPDPRGRSVSSERVRRSPRRRSITPRPGHSPRGSLSPSRRRSSYTRRRSRSGSYRRSPSPIRRRFRSPYRRRSRSPMRRRTPVRRRSPSPPVRRRSPSPPLRRRSPSPPLRRRSPSPPLRRRSPSPLVRRRYPSPPVRHRSPSPRVRRRSPSPPLRRRSPYSPLRRRSPSPVRRRFRSPIQRRSLSPLSPSPRGRRLPSPRRRRSPSPRLRGSLSPRLRRFSSPRRHISPSPVRRMSPSPFERRSPSPAQRRHQRSPSTPQRRSHSPMARRSSGSSRKRSLSPYGSSSPSPVRHGSPSPVRKKSPERQSRSSVQAPRERISSNEKSSSARHASTKEKDDHDFDMSRGIESSAVRPPSSLRSPQRELKGRNNSKNRALSSSASPEKSPTLSESPSDRRRRITSEDSREYSDLKPKTLEKRPANLSSMDKQKDSPFDASKKKVHPSESLVIVRDIESNKYPDLKEVRKNDQELRSGRISGRTVHSEVDQQKSPLRIVGESQHVPYSGEGKRAEEKNSTHSNSMKDGGGHHKSESVAKSVKKSDQGNHSGSFDSGAEDIVKYRSEKEKRKHKRSSRHEVSSDDEYSSESHTKDKKEAKRKRKEEKRLRKEKKRLRHEEKRQKKEDRRAEKLKARTNDAVTPSLDFEKKESVTYNSDGEQAAGRESTLDDAKEAERLEIELRNKALESLKAKKGIRH